MPGPYIAEIVRAGIQSVSHGQTEAAFALGIKPNWTMRLVILPQALRVIIPPLDQPVPEPDQELLAGDRRGLHGHRGDDRRHLPQPDRTGAGMHVDRASPLPGLISAFDLGRHELVQQARRAGGAVSHGSQDRRSGQQTYAPGTHPDLPPPLATDRHASAGCATTSSRRPTNIALTLLSLYLLYLMVPALLNWAIFDAVINAGSRNECRDKGFRRLLGGDPWCASTS